LQELDPKSEKENEMEQSDSLFKVFYDQLESDLDGVSSAQMVASPTSVELQTLLRRTRIIRTLVEDRFVMQKTVHIYAIEKTFAGKQSDDDRLHLADLDTLTYIKIHEKYQSKLNSCVEGLKMLQNLSHQYAKPLKFIDVQPNRLIIIQAAPIDS
jgi:hypothetical protein